MSMAVCQVDGNGNVLCGTGDWNGPKPGDPDMQNITLQAAGTYGGVELTWTWPGINPGAVSHTILWRSLQNDFETASKHAIVQGNYYLDRVDLELNLDTQYFYWVQMVSIYNTVGDEVGPASATAKPLIGQMLDLLTGQINAGQLATGLSSEIDQITLNKLGITAEELARDANDEALAVRISELSAQTDDAMAILQEEIRLRTDADGAFVQVVNTMYADFDGNIGAIQTEVTAMATEVAALASEVTTVSATVNGDTASGQVGLVAEVETLNGEVVNIGARWTATVDVNGLVGGFGIYNDGSTVEAGFNVDRFWVGSTNDNKRKPFIIEGGVTYIDEAAINQLTFSKLKAEDGSFIVADGKIKADYLVVNNIQSDNWVNNSTGWALRPDGSFQLNGLIAGEGRMTITNRAIKVYDSNGVVRVQMGDLNA